MKCEVVSGAVECYCCALAGLFSCSPLARFCIQMLFSYSEFKPTNHSEGHANQTQHATPSQDKLPMVGAVGGAWRITAEDSNGTWLRVKMSMKTHKIEGKNKWRLTLISLIVFTSTQSQYNSRLKVNLRDFKLVNTRYDSETDRRGLSLSTRQLKRAHSAVAQRQLTLAALTKVKFWLAS